MSSSRRPWVPDLQSPSLRSFTLHRPLPFASPLQILLWLRLWRYHWDHLALIYTFVEASTPSETAYAPMRLSKVLFRSSHALHSFHAPPRATSQLGFSWRAPTHHISRSHTPHALSRTYTCLNPLTNVIHVSPSSTSALVAPLLTSLVCISR